MNSHRVEQSRPGVPTIKRPRCRGASALVGILAVLALTTASCGGAGDAERSIAVVNIDGGAGFDPATITVHKNDKVKIAVGNSTDKTHGFTVEGYGIRQEVETGTPTEVKFTASRAGTYKILCQLHPAHQTATLVVE